MSDLIIFDPLDKCRICLTSPENVAFLPFVDIMSFMMRDDESKMRMFDVGITMESLNDFNPKMICKLCAAALESWSTTKKTANESDIVFNYIVVKKFGVTTPETSNASTPSMMLRNNGESSREPPINHSRLPSKRSNLFGDSMPGTSKASTSSMTLRNNEESSWEPPINHSRLPSKRSNRFGDSMPGTSKASTLSMTLRNNGESSREPPINHSRLPSKRSNRFGDSMPGTSKASTSSMTLRNNEESSWEPPIKHSRLPLNRSNKFGDSMPGTSKSSRETPFENSQLLSNRSNKFGDPMPGTSKASTSLVLRNNEESSRESPFKNSQLPSNRSNKFGDSMPGTSKSSRETPFKNSQLSSNRSNKFGDSIPGTSKASTSSNRNNEESSYEAQFNHSRLPSKRSNKNGLDNSTRSLITNHSNPQFDDESDDDSCIIVAAPIETIEIISDDEESKYDNDIEIVGISYYEEPTELSQNEVVIESSQNEEVIFELSSDSEDNEDNLKTEYINNVTEKLYYCSICQKKNILNHDCSQHTQSFFTCLVPCCNILSRSKKDFTFHYQPHIGMSSSGTMCHRCFKGIDQSNIDGNGYHIGCDTTNAFKCYSCDVSYSCIQQFAYHKLKSHKGILMDALGNYLCLYCEESFPDILETNDHMKYCLENQEKNEKETELLPVNINTMQNVTVRTNKNKKKIPRTSQHILFTCLKPSCNKVFQTFSNFKHHYRRHFELGSDLVCWQCCKPFSGTHDLRAHQIRNNCRTPGMYKCFQCSSKFDDIENLSIHKLTFHKGKLIAGKKNRKTIMCAFCQMHINIFNFESHLVTCQKKDDKETTCTTKKEDKKTICTTKNKVDYPCLTCGRVFKSSISLSNHSRIHKPSRISNFKKEYTRAGAVTKTRQKFFTCDVCHASFKEKHHVARHCKIHTGDKPYKCTICGKLFRDQSNLTNHKCTQNVEKRFQCIQCGKRFMRNDNLLVHYRMHSHEKPYECDLCEKKFSTSGNLSRHKRTIHKHCF